jgi:hypothetical protein
MPIKGNDAVPEVKPPTRPEEPTETTAKMETVATGRTAPSNEPVKQDRPEPKVDKDAVPQSYVWLADGSVIRVNNEDLPGASSTFMPNGHWQRDDKVYEIVGIYPVESVVEEN